MCNLRVLIVEDDTVSATLHKAMLESEGHSIVGVARHEEEAIALAESQKPDLVLMDIYLEGNTTGVHAAKVLYSSYELPVIFITCGTAVGQLRELVDSDAFALIKKPVSLEELRVNLSIVMRRASEIRKNQERYACCETLMDLLPVAIFAMRESGKIDWCNMACAKTLGFSTPDEFCSAYITVDSLLADAEESLLIPDVNSRFSRKVVNKNDVIQSKTFFKMEHPDLNMNAQRSFFVLE